MTCRQCWNAASANGMKLPGRNEAKVVAQSARGATCSRLRFQCCMFVVQRWRKSFIAKSWDSGGSLLTALTRRRQTHAIWGWCVTPRGYTFLHFQVTGFLEALCASRLRTWMGCTRNLSRRACRLIPGRWTKRWAREKCMVGTRMGTASALSARLMANDPLLVGVSRDSMIWTDRNVCPTLARDLFRAM